MEVGRPYSQTEIRELQWRPRETKRNRDRPQCRWVVDIRKTAVINWEQQAGDREKWKTMEEIYIQEWMVENLTWRIYAYGHLGIMGKIDNNLNVLLLPMSHCTHVPLFINNIWKFHWKFFTRCLRQADALILIGCYDDNLHFPKMFLVTWLNCQIDKWEFPWLDIYTCRCQNNRNVDYFQQTSIFNLKISTCYSLLTTSIMNCKCFWSSFATFFSSMANKERAVVFLH